MIIKMFYVYLLQSKKDKSIYIGYCGDLRKRFMEHNQGNVRTTRNKKPFILVYYEAYRNKTDARKREIALKKQGMQREFLFTNLKNSLLI